METLTQTDKDNRYLQLTTKHYGINLGCINQTVPPLEVMNPHMNAKFDWLYILTDQDAELYKDKGFVFKFNKFMEDDWFAVVYISKFYMDAYTFPNDGSDGFYRCKLCGLRNIIFDKLGDYIKKNKLDFIEVNCVLSNEENFIEGIGKKICC